MGAHNNFSPPGHSSYELPNLDAVCFSYMTAEQLCNWMLMAGTYVVSTEDVNWARDNRHVVAACLDSLLLRRPGVWPRLGRWFIGDAVGSPPAPRPPRRKRVVFRHQSLA